MRPLPPAVCAKVISSEPSHRSIQNRPVGPQNVAGGAVGRLSGGTDGRFGVRIDKTQTEHNESGYLLIADLEQLTVVNVDVRDVGFFDFRPRR